MKNYPINSKQNGLTLIEILVAMVIGLFLLAGVMQIFLGSQQSYRLQENLSRMQENGRFAMDFLTRDIRMAGSSGCVLIGDIENMLNLGSVFDAFDEGISGEEGVNNSPDEITINSMLPSDIFVDKIPGTPGTPAQVKVSQAADLKVTPNTILNKEDIVLVTNCDKGDIFQITNLNPSKVNVVHNTGQATEPGNRINVFSVAYGSDSQIYRPNFVTYSIYKPPERDSVIALYRSVNGADRQALVENIEDMQILYGEDTSSDNTPNHYVSEDRVTDMNNVISVRISLLAISPENNLVSNITPYTYNGVEITPTDKRLRQVFSSTIAVRSQLP